MEEQESISIAEARSVLDRALHAIIRGDVRGIELFTEDVVGESPNMFVISRTELGNQLLDRARAFSNLEFTIDRLERAAPGFVATWHMSADHTGDVLFNEDEFFEATGRRIELSAMTWFQFRARLICAFRTTYDGRDPFDEMRRRPVP